MTCFTVRFEDVANGKDILLKDLLQNTKPGKGADANKLTADKIYVWNGGSYDTYFLHTSGVWCKEDETTETTNKVAFGTAIFYKKGSMTTGVATFSGALANDETISVPVKNGSMSFLTYPWPVEQTLEQIAATISKPGKGADENKLTADKIYKWNGGSYDTYYCHTSGSWCKAGSTTPIEPGSVKFGPNEGFFLKKGSMTTGTMDFKKPF